MTEDEMVELLREILDAADTESVVEWGIDRTDTFGDRGLLTLDAGLVVRMSDGSEFQVTVVRSRGAYDER